MLNTWTCHSCGEERPDENVSVATFPMKNLPGGEINIRYCNDREKCRQRAVKAGSKGKFPKIIVPKSKKKAKKWWQFWG